MSLIRIDPSSLDVELALAYATPDNIAGRPIYRHARFYLHQDAVAALARAVALARALGLRLRIFDAFRPTEAQWVLWRACPDPQFLADPRRGSPMGTGFDDLRPLAHHASLAVSPEAQRNRALLLGLMTAAGWDFYRNEWWHYQLFNARRYPLYSDSALAHGLM